MKELFEHLEKENISPNGFYVLYSIHQKIIPKSFVNSSLEARKLQIDGWLSSDFNLTKKSIILVSDLEGYFKKVKTKNLSSLMGNNYLEKIQEYVTIFPKGKLKSGKLARVNVKTLENSFKWFFENYEYSWDTIISATQKYVDEYSSKGYEYMRTSQYFIRKQNIDKTFDSELATYCDMILEGGDDYEEHSYFPENVV